MDGYLLLNHARAFEGIGLKCSTDINNCLHVAKRVNPLVNNITINSFFTKLFSNNSLREVIFGEGMNKMTRY